MQTRKELSMREVYRPNKSPKTDAEVMNWLCQISSDVCSYCDLPTDIHTCTCVHTLQSHTVRIFRSPG